MSKEFLVPLAGMANDDALVDAALAFAVAHDARLAIFVPAPIPTPMATPWGITADAVVAELYGLVEREAAERAQALRQRLRNVETPWDVRVDRARYLEPSIAFAHAARYADLAIVPQPSGEDAAIGHEYFSAALFESGRPVLVMPHRMDRIVRTRRILVGWKPTREGTRAVHDALALFAPEQADIVVVDPVVGPAGQAQEPGVDIAMHLARHGIAVTTTALPAGGKSVATTLLLQAAATQADVVVAGGYGHARLREWVLGGATRDLLEQLEFPVLFSH